MRWTVRGGWIGILLGRKSWIHLTGKRWSDCYVILSLLLKVSVS